jgi:hypothetical protein
MTDNTEAVTVIVADGPGHHAPASPGASPCNITRQGRTATARKPPATLASSWIASRVAVPSRPPPGSRVIECRQTPIGGVLTLKAVVRQQ